MKCPLIVVLGNNDLGEKNGLLEVSKSFDCEIVEEPYSFLAEDKKTWEIVLRVTKDLRKLVSIAKRKREKSVD